MKRAPVGTRVIIRRPSSVLEGRVGVVHWANHKHAWLKEIDGLRPSASRLVMWRHLEKAP